jgi:hypothetical protein
MCFKLNNFTHLSSLDCEKKVLKLNIDSNRIKLLSLNYISIVLLKKYKEKINLNL